MKAGLVLLVLLGALAIWVVAGCGDRVRENCETAPTATRCEVTP